MDDDRTRAPEPESGGDPACWAALVCPACGRLAEAPRSDRCAACGEPFPVEE